MKVLFVSGELIAGDLAYRLKLEGCGQIVFTHYSAIFLTKPSQMLR